MFVFRLFDQDAMVKAVAKFLKTGKVKEPAWADIAKLATQGTCADEPRLVLLTWLCNYFQGSMYALPPSFVIFISDWRALKLEEEETKIAAELAWTDTKKSLLVW